MLLFGGFFCFSKTKKLDIQTYKKLLYERKRGIMVGIGITLRKVVLILTIKEVMYEFEEICFFKINIDGNSCGI